MSIENISGTEDEEFTELLIRKIDEAIRLLKQQYGQEYEIIDNSWLEFPR